MAKKIPLYDPLFHKYPAKAATPPPVKPLVLNNKKLTLDSLGLIPSRIETDAGGEIPVLVNIAERVCLPMPKAK
jgi:hypothetical protein